MARLYKYNKKEIGKTIKKSRKNLLLSQEKLAEMTGLQRTAITQIEAGRREISSSELILFSEIFDTSLEELLYREEIKEDPVGFDEEYPLFNRKKFIELFLYILESCGSRFNVGKTVLYKLFYFIDFDYYELYEEYLTGEIYRKIQHGPAPCHFNRLEEDLIRNEIIKKDIVKLHNYNQIKYTPLREADMNIFTGREIKLIDNEIKKLSSMNARQIEDYSHHDVPWIISEEREIINYEAVFYRKEMHSVRED